MRCAMKCIDKFLAPPPTPIMNRRLEMITENQSDQNNQGDQGYCKNRVCLLKRKRLTVTHICRYAINNLNGATSRGRE